MTSYGGVEEHLFDDDDHHHHYSFTEICSELYHKEGPNDQDPDSSCSSPFTLSPTSSLSSEDAHQSLFGFESSDDDSVRNEACSNGEAKLHCRRRECGRRSRRESNGRFPPPIPCIGMSGKPLVSLQKIRQDGRFILVEVMVPSHEFIHARRENGCLKLHFVHSESESESESGKSRQAMEA